jgi:hypothetical protein
MALLDAEGFEITSQTVLSSSGQQFTGTFTFTTTNRHIDYAGNGGAKALQYPGNGNWYSRSVGTSAAEVTMYQYHNVSWPASSSNAYGVEFQLAGQQQCFLNFGFDGYLRLYQGGSILDVSTATFPRGVGLWVEMYCVAANAGTMIVKINGVTFINFSGDTQREASPGWDRIRTYAGSGATMIIDDVYIWDTQNSMPYGSEEYIVLLPPTSDVSVALTRSAGAANYETVDENPFSASDYNEGTSATLEDIYGHSGLPWTPTSIAFVGVAFYGSRDGTLTTWTPLIDSGTKDYGSAFAPGASGTSALDYQFWEVDPNTASAWAAAAVNATDFGAKVD